MVSREQNKKPMGYVENLETFLIQALNLGKGRYLFNYADKPDMTVQELVDQVRHHLGIRKSLLRLPYPVGLLGGYAFDALSRLTGRRLPISTTRIRKFCATTTASTHALEQIRFKAPFTLYEGLKRMIVSMGTPVDQNPAYKSTL